MAIFEFSNPSLKNTARLDGSLDQPTMEFTSEGNLIAFTSEEADKNKNERYIN